MADPEPEKGAKKGAEKPKRTYKRRFTNQTQALGGKFQPLNPTCGQDLMGAWALPQEAWDGVRLKICKKKYGAEGTLDLLAETTIEEFDLESIAREFGAQEYTLIMPSDSQKRWGAHTIRINVSAEYARNAGWNAIPQIVEAPRFSNYRAVREASNAVQNPGTQPFTPDMLASLIETVVDRVAARLQPQPTAIVQDPMAQFAGMFKVFDMIQGQTQNAVKQALEIAGMKTPAILGGESEGTSWPEVIMAALPTVAEAAKVIFARPDPRPEQQPYYPPQPLAIPVPPPTKEVGPMQIQVPITEEEAKSFSGAIALLRPFKGHIVSMLAKVENGDEIAKELARFIPEALEGDIIRLANIAGDRGEKVLAIISPELATVKALQCVVAIGAFFQGSGNETD